MLKNVSQLEHKVGEKLYRFVCDIDSPINDVKEALAQFLALATQISNQAPSAAPPEVIPAEVS